MSLIACAILAMLFATSGSPCYAESAEVSQNATAKTSLEPDSRLLQLEKSLDEELRESQAGSVTAEKHAAFVRRFRATLDAEFARLPHTPANASQYALILARLGKEQTSQALAAIDANLEQNAQNGTLLNAKARILFEQGNYRSAADAARLAWESSGQRDAEALALMRMSEGRSGTTARATAAPAAAPTAPAGMSERRIDVQFSKKVEASPVRSAAEAALENTPLEPVVQDRDRGGHPLASSIATTALAATGSLLLFGGLAGKSLEGRFPNLRRDMGIAAGIGGAIAVSAVSWPAISPILVGPNAARVEEAVEEYSSAQTNTPLQFAFNKEQARAAIEALQLPEAQANGALSTIKRGTASSTFRITQQAGDVVVRTIRKGYDGYQIFEHRVTPTGEKTIVQTAYNAAGKLVHHDPK